MHPPASSPSALQSARPSLARRCLASARFAVAPTGASALLAPVRLPLPLVLHLPPVQERGSAGVPSTAALSLSFDEWMDGAGLRST